MLRVGSALSLTLALVAATLAGCVNVNVTPESPAAGPVAASFAAAGGQYTLDGSSGGLTTLFVDEGEGAVVSFGENVLIFTEDGRLLPFLAGDEAMAVAPDAPLRFIPPPGAKSLNLTVGDERIEVALAEGDSFIRGMHVIELLEHQEANFPHRTPGHENYALSQQYFAEYFESLGLDVEIDPYGTMAFDGVKAPDAARGISPSSLANVVAYKPGTANPPKYVVFGAHYDMVEQTVHSAFDNTGGTMAVMELARVFANVTTEHTLVFGLWGGEEDGILGSRFWVETNLDLVPSITAAINLDVTGLAWPGPVTPAADPIMVTAGPDGPIADRLHDQTRTIVTDWARFGSAPVLYQPIGLGGQVGGSGVNAQSDHTSFATHGIPSFMFSTGNIETVFALIHKPSDTLANMTAYMVTGQVPYDGALTPEEEALGRDLLAKSYAAQMYLPFYYTLLLDAGLA